MLPSMNARSFEREVQPLDDKLHHSAGTLWYGHPACDIYEDAVTYFIAVALPRCHAD
jgi:hypothetical protein